MTNGGEGVGRDELTAVVFTASASREELPAFLIQRDLYCGRMKGIVRNMEGLIFYPTCKWARQSPAVPRALEEDTRFPGPDTKDSLLLRATAGARVPALGTGHQFPTSQFLERIVMWASDAQV